MSGGRGRGGPAGDSPAEVRREGSGCVSRGTLVRHLDGELAGDLRERVRCHLETCARCRDRLEALRERDRAVRAWIREHDPEPPAPAAYELGPASGGDGGGGRAGRGPATLRWLAAAVVVLAVGVVLAGPASGWILDTLRSLVDGSDPEVGAVSMSGRAGPAGAIAFVPAGDELLVAFSSSETRGELTVEASRDSLVTFTPPSDAVELTVEGARLEVRNAGAAAGDYRLSVPASLRTLRIRVPGADEAVVRLPLRADGGAARARTFRLPPD